MDFIYLSLLFWSKCYFHIFLKHHHHQDQSIKNTLTFENQILYFLNRLRAKGKTDTDHSFISSQFPSPCLSFLLFWRFLCTIFVFQDDPSLVVQNMTSESNMQYRPSLRKCGQL